MFIIVFISLSPYKTSKLIMNGDFILSTSIMKPLTIVRGRAEFSIRYLTVKVWLLHNYIGSNIDDELVARTERIFHMILETAHYGIRRWNPVRHLYEYVFIYDSICPHYLSNKRYIYSRLFMSAARLMVRNLGQNNEYSVMDILMNDDTYQSFIDEWSDLPTLSKLLTMITLISRRLFANSVYNREFPREITEKIICHMYDIA